MDNNRLVYSTESGRICPSCGHPTTKCTCKKKKNTKKQSIYPKDGIVRIRREVKGRKGKTVTAVFGVPLDDKKLQQFAKTWETLQKEIKQQGYNVKIAGG